MYCLPLQFTVRLPLRAHLGVACLGLLAIYGLIRLYYSIELLITDPYLEAGLYFPVRTFCARYLQSRPIFEDIRTFVMTPSNSFAINLPKDVERLKAFKQINKGRDIQTFAAFEWVVAPADAKIASTKSPAAVQRGEIVVQQREMAKRFPWIHHSVKRRQYGDAGCTLSHIILLEQLLRETSASAESDYYFVFEDDVEIHHELLQYGNVTAPRDAHVIFLPNTSTKRVRIPMAYTRALGRSKNDQRPPVAIRVLQGYGALGYIITRDGAALLIDHMQRHRQPIDVALAGGSRTLHVYHPLKVGTLPSSHDVVRWVKHRQGLSTRQESNS